MKALLFTLFLLVTGSVSAQVQADRYMGVLRCYVSDESVIYVPTLITPNGDGVNDKWLIGWTGNINPHSYYVEVLNSMGYPAASIMPMGSHFDGRSLAEGTYRWKIIRFGSKAVVSSGDLTVNRQKPPQRQGGSYR